jgi:hypothetical protein
LKLALNLLREEDEAAAVEMVNAATLEAVVVVVAAAAAEGTTLNSNSSKALTLEIPTPSHHLLKPTLTGKKKRKSIPLVRLSLSSS